MSVVLPYGFHIVPIYPVARTKTKWSNEDYRVEGRCKVCGETRWTWKGRTASQITVKRDGTKIMGYVCDECLGKKAI